ncbi:sensor histidine kinase [Enterococcus durans]|uniref:cache domain-containing sensor histidine kinase n=1 Tax=Enterococcus durans TaxID=53345 RepID=UPI0039A53475
MKAKLKEYELFTKLFIILFIALFTQAIIISLFIYHQSKEAYINLFDKSNEQSLVKIQRDFEMLNDNIEKTLSSITENSGVESYFSTENQPALSKLSDLKEIHQMTLGFTAISPYIDYDLMIFGENGRTFVGNDLIASMDANAFFQLEIRNKIDQVSASTQMVFVDFGLTQKNQAEKSILFVKKLQTSLNRVYGYAVIAISSKQMAHLFSTMINPDISKIYLLNEEQTVFSSNEAAMIGTTSDLFTDLTSNGTKTFGSARLTRLPLYRQNSTLISKVDSNLVTNQMGILFPIIFFNLIILILVGGVVFSYMNRQTKSIYALIHSIKQNKETAPNAHVSIQGTYETKVLGSTINQLLDTIEESHERSIKAEKKKRILEIQTMQAQIQPHFIYNTLTSLKFLIWQGKNEETITGIDHFIDLLRSTIGKKEELITVGEELNSVQSYIHILALRYGDEISTRIMVPEELFSFKVPNMMIQPIIENAYLHAFQSKKTGFITLFGKLHDDSLIFEVVDSGDGFDTSLTKKTTDFFSGIGIKNVDERIRLSFGEAYGLTIESFIGVGTTVRITLPIIE